MGIFVRNGKLRPGWRVTFYLLVYLLGAFVVQLTVLGVYSTALLLQGEATMPEIQARLAELDLPLWLLTTLKAATALWTLLLTGLFGRFLDRRRFAEFGLRLSSGWLADVGLGLALGAIHMAVIVGVEWIGGWVGIAALPQTVVRVRLADAGTGLLFFALVAVAEELLHRGYVQTNLWEGSGPVVALAVSSLLFGLFHAFNPNLTWLGLINLVLAGVALGYGYWATGRLWLPIAYHLSWNFVQGSILGLPVSGMRYGGLLIVADRGPAWLTGGAFGPEGGLIGTLVLLTALPVFWWWGTRTGRWAGWKAGRPEG